MGTLSIKRGKRNRVITRVATGVIDRVVDPAIFRGSYRGLGLAEGRRGLYRAQPVILSPSSPSDIFVFRDLPVGGFVPIQCFYL